MKGLSRKKFHQSRRKFSTASHSTHPKVLNAHDYASCWPFLAGFVEPDLNSRLPWSVLKTANHGSICDSSPRGWADDYFWLCVGAYSSDWSSAAMAGTSARLILTHDPCIWHTKPNQFSKRRALLIKLTSRAL